MDGVEYFAKKNWRASKYLEPTAARCVSCIICRFLQVAYSQGANAAVWTT